VLTPSSGRRSVTTYFHMTVLAVRYESGTARRFGRSDESRRMHMEQLRERIELDRYAVDPQKVADAIVRRLLAEARRH
jgi:anti-sigma28 factor (negative regulator of flagellin synthesis)